MEASLSNLGVRPECSRDAAASLSAGAGRGVPSVRLTLHYRPKLMTLPDSNDPRETFEYFSNEYAQALQALEAIEKQAPTLLLMGHGDHLRQFVDQFLEMARRTRDLAAEKGETNFAEWFGELVEKGEKLRT